MYLEIIIKEKKHLSGQVSFWANQIPGFFAIINILRKNQLIPSSDHCQHFLFNYLVRFQSFITCWFRICAYVNTNLKISQNSCFRYTLREYIFTQQIFAIGRSKNSKFLEINFCNWVMYCEFCRIYFAMGRFKKPQNNSEIAT